MLSYHRNLRRKRVNHVVFTLDHLWNPLLWRNQQVCYDLLYEVASGLLKAYGQRYLGGEVGFIGVLHTWGQQMTYHVHLHCIVMGGGLRADGEFVRSRTEVRRGMRRAA